MAKFLRFGTGAIIIFSMAVFKICLSETSTFAPKRWSGGEKEKFMDSTLKRNKMTENQYSPRNTDIEIPFGEKSYQAEDGGGKGVEIKGRTREGDAGDYREGKSKFIKDNLRGTNRNFYRRNQNSKSEYNKRPSSERWDRKEDDYFGKLNAETLTEKNLFQKIDKSSDSNSRESKSKSSDQFRHGDDVRYASQKNVDLEEGYESLPIGSKHRKIKRPTSSGSFGSYSTSSRERKPNIVLILTDDQDVELGSLNFMPKTMRLLRDGGAEFRHAYVTTPMCCPSRSSLLTGMYVHNHNVFTNNENCSSVQWQQTHETRTFATYLSNAGYRTGYFGKYLNKYNGSYIPPGWREWGGLIMNSRYYNYSINLNGKKIKHGFDYHKDYYPDLITNDSISFLRQSKQYFSRKPVMLVVSFPAPHGPEDSAPQYSKMFFNITTHHTPSYDYAPNPDKQWILRVTNKMQDIHKQFTDTLMTKRLQTLQSVDAAVERIYQELKNIGELDNTYIIYTSDHGYHLGQFGLVKGKSFPFEFDVRVPFLVRGPGIEAGAVVDDIVLNIDLAPTFLDLAGVESPMHIDGRSFVRLLHHKSNKRRRIKWPDTFLIESSGRRELPETLEAKRWKQEKLKAKENRWSKEKTSTTTDYPDTVHGNSMKSKNRVYTTRPKMQKGEREESLEGYFVDETENSDEEGPSALFNHESQYDGLLISSDSDSQVDNKIPQLAQVIDQPLPKLSRLALECQNPGLQTPCQPGQKWHCVIDGDRWRKYKCKLQKKCTCFTPNGFVYTALYNEEGGKKMNFSKKRSDSFDLWSQVSERVDSTTLLSVMSRSSKVMNRRRRRETSEEHISDVWDDLQHELMEAEETKTQMNVTYSLGREPNTSTCSVTVQGKVNCSRLVYNDLKTWKRSRNEIELKIIRLKNELEALKEIRKHLREKRPSSVITTELSQRNVTTPTTFVPEESSEYPSTKAISEVNEFDNESLLSTTLETSANESEFFTSRPHATSNMGNSSRKISMTTTATTTEKSTVGISRSHNSNRGNFENGENGISNRINGVVTVFRGRDKCICRSEGQDVGSKKEEKELAKEAKRKLKEERLRKKERKLRKKAKLEKECLSEKMNCFLHDNDHWRTPPLWTQGPFCFCMNANNNTYSCLRTINSTHNFLYCEFTTGFKTFYNLRIDPFEQLNRISTLTPDESRFLSNQLEDMKACRGNKECTMASGRENFGTGHSHQNHHHHSHHRYHHRQPNQQQLQHQSYDSSMEKELMY